MKKAFYSTHFLSLMTFTFPSFTKKALSKSQLLTMNKFKFKILSKQTQEFILYDFIPVNCVNSHKTNSYAGFLKGHNGYAVIQPLIYCKLSLWASGSPQLINPFEETWIDNYRLDS